MKKKITKFWMICLALFITAQVSAKQIYVRLSSDSQAWSAVTQDADNIVVVLAGSNLSTDAFWSTLVSGDVIWVAKGVYNSTAAIVMPAGVTMYGGFYGDETSVDDRAISDADGNGYAEAWEFTNVTNIRGTDETSSFALIDIRASSNVIDGFTLSDNTVTVGYEGAAGSGAVYLEKGQVNKCIIRDVNYYLASGTATAGALMCQKGGTIDHCLFEFVEAKASGGSLYGAAVMLQNAGSALTNSVLRAIKGESTNRTRAVIYANDAARIENCILYNNEITGLNQEGGAIYVANSNDIPEAEVILAGLTLVNNICENGAGMMVTRSNTHIYNCIMWGNVKSDLLTYDAAFFTTASIGITFSKNSNAFNGKLSNIFSPDVTNVTSLADLVELGTVNSSDETGGDGQMLYAPKFINPTTFVGIPFSPSKVMELYQADWTIEATSPLVNKGVLASVDPVVFDFANADILGMPRTASISIGAFEVFDADQLTTAIFSEEESVEINVYPTVTSGRVNIKSERKINQISVYSLTGANVLNATMGATSGVVDLSALKSGLYLLNISTDKGIRVVKIMVK